MSSNNLTQHITTHTRITNKGSSLIDHVYSNTSNISAAGTININISDHLPVFISRKKLKEEKLLTNFKCRKLKNYDRETLKLHLLDYVWEEYYNNNDPNECWELLIHHIRNVLEKLYPLVTYNKVRVKAKWITSEIFEAMLYRDNLYTIARNTNDKDDWIKAKKEINKVNLLCKNAKTNFIKTNIENNTKDPKKFWKQINNLWSVKSTTGDKKISLTDTNTGIKIEENKVADHLNHYFSNVGPHLQQKIAPLTREEMVKLSTDSSYKDYNNTPEECFTFRAINTEELQI